MNRLALFDCDGTLIDSQSNICLAMEQAFVLSRLAAPPRASVRRIVGLSLVEAVAELLPEGNRALHAHIAADYKRAFQGMRAKGLVDEPLFDGIAELLEQLLDDGWLLGVATGKSDQGLAHVLENHKLSGHFITLQTADRHPSKPHPSMVQAAMKDAQCEPETTVVIGDTSYDIAMALNAGVRAVGVAWGYHPPLELTRAGAHAIAATPADVMPMLEVA